MTEETTETDPATEEKAPSETTAESPRSEEGQVEESKEEKTPFQEGLEKAIKDELNELVSNGREDVAKFAEDMAEQAALAMAVGDEDALLELQAQVTFLAEKHRIRCVNSGWNVMTKLVGSIVKVAIATAT